MTNYPVLVTATNSSGSSVTGSSVIVTAGVGALTLILSNSSLSNLGAQNAGAVVGNITVTGTQTTPITIGGADAALFAVTNGGIAPCNLISAVNIPAGSYSITLTVT